MYPRVEYEMTEEQLKQLLDACKPVPYMVIGGHAPSSPQENANRAWMGLGKEMGFDWETVRPVQGKGQRFFTAVPSETDDQRKERLAKEAEVKKQNRIKEIEAAINDLQSELNALTGP